MTQVASARSERQRILQRQQQSRSYASEERHKANRAGMSTAAQAQHVRPVPTAALHPSWAARQKQREAYAAATPSGNKIVFGDDRRPAASMQVPILSAGLVKPAVQPAAWQAETLHPSWLAKKAAASKQACDVDRLGSAASKVKFPD